MPLILGNTLSNVMSHVCIFNGAGNSKGAGNKSVAGAPNRAGATSMGAPHHVKGAHPESKIWVFGTEVCTIY